MFKIKSISQLDIAPIPRYLLTMEANTIGTWTLTEQPVTTPKWRTRVTWPGSLRTWPPWTTTIRSTSTILRWNGLIHFFSIRVVHQWGHSLWLKICGLKLELTKNTNLWGRQYKFHLEAKTKLVLRNEKYFI